MALLDVDTALSRICAGVVPVASEVVELAAAAGRVLAEDLAARLTQPPFDASAMDGYAVRSLDVATLPTELSVIGEAAAGRAFAGVVAAGQAVRIFTGAPVPAGADSVVIQENVEIVAGRSNAVRVVDGGGGNIRRRGGDFSAGQRLLFAGRRISARDVTLAAAMGHDRLSVRRKPVVAILATGDELVPPGVTPRADQIVSSNPYGIAAMVRAAGGEPLLLGIARDTQQSLAEHIASAAAADVLVTIGGASVGDHDLVAPALQAAGMTLDFWKIAMRPGKPMIFGRRGEQRVVGLPGNPVSSLICARVFLVPLVARLLADAAAAPDRPSPALLAGPLEANGPRRHYMRASTVSHDGGRSVVMPASSQDSSLMSTLAAADCLIVREPGATALAAGAEVSILGLDF